MEKKHFGFGIVGAGMIAHFHAKAIAELTNARLIGVYSVNQPKSDAFASQHSCTAYHTLEHMLADAEIDIVCICTPSGIHLEPALKSIEAGKHCLIEKPLEITVERCDQILAAARKAGVKVGVIFPSRFYEASSQLKESLNENRFGDLVLGGAYVKWHRSEAYYASGRWRGTWEYDGGGALMNQGIHSVDLLQWYMGPVESVQAVAANIRHKNIEVEDTIVATLNFKNGALGTIECSTAVFPGTLKRIEIMGTEGTAILEEDSFIKWQFQREDSVDERIRSSMKEETASAGGASNPADISFVGHQRQMADLIRAIETGDEPFINGEEGRKSVEIVRAIYESARTGTRVKLPISL
ncbi:Gfo/Idh/MocA family protein [Parapedobacter indicus]|uniref:Predicted dehydrogenase n=1 Tax=Parapedobacter indicus TaxID=1477437 RepID=A0A1I3HQI8_9SPHI|nr:Gfo/Idh/MocA family oxidoreductase [Parapedobacter indicus]PPL03126.1 putative dehydrogenase [Parapedobacter indicus]SFI37827.1 Predicted dehydrogenase [Parapedobacter indicus]